MVSVETGERVLRLQEARKAARDGEEDGIADRDADGIVHLLETIDVEHQHRRAALLVALGVHQRGFQTVEEEFAVGKARQVVMDGVVKQPLFGRLELGDVAERTDEPHHLPVRPDDRTRPQHDPDEMTVGGT